MNEDIATFDSNRELVNYATRRWSTMQTELTVWQSWFEEIAYYVQPRKASQIINKITTPTTYPEAVLYDSTAVRSNMTFARGMMSSNTPAGAPWFSFSASKNKESDDDLDAFYAHATEVAQAAMAASNFYDRELEDLLDYGAYGTSCMFCEEGIDTALNFKNFMIGSYAILEDADGRVNTIAREYEMTPRQMRSDFGLKSFPAELRKLIDKPADPGWDQKRSILHLIEPRAEYDVTKNDGENKPIASIYIDLTEQHLLRNAGFYEMPAFVSRFLKWGNSAYGWSPSWSAMPDARQANYLEKHTDALAEVIAWPRLLVPDSHEGQIDIRASGVTYYSPAAGGAKPEEWLTNGRMDASIERIQSKRKAIEEAYFVDLFQMFSNREKPITAYEASLLNGEKLTLLAATTSSRNSEHYNPLLRRVWGILLRQGAFGEIPEELIEYGPDGMGYIPDPEIAYNSKIALAIKAVETNAWLDIQQTDITLWQMDPTLLDNFDLDWITRNNARNRGLPSDGLRPEDEVAELRAARAQQQQLIQQMESQESAARTVKDSSQALKVAA